MQTEEAGTAGVEAHRYAFLDSMEGIRLAEDGPPPSAGGLGARLRAVYPGLLVAATIALAATWLSQHYKSPVMLLALLFGTAFHFLHEDTRCRAGIDLTSRTVLRLGVALLGAKITFGQIAGLGPMPIITVVVGVASTIAVGVLAAGPLGRSRAFGVLSGGAVAICGASAALAIASILPRTPERERDTILTVVTVTALSTLAMVLYPMIATGVGLDHVRAGIFLGGTIHDVAQVVGAGYTISPRTGDVATYVKLLRVALLLPTVFLLGFAFRRRSQALDPAERPPFPWFLLGFAALVAAGSLGFIPKAGVEAASDVSRWCLVAAVAALGMKTSFAALMQVGWRPVALIVAETAWIGGLVLSATLLWG